MVGSPGMGHPKARHSIWVLHVGCWASRRHLRGWALAFNAISVAGALFCLLFVLGHGARSPLASRYKALHLAPAFNSQRAQAAWADVPGGPLVFAGTQGTGALSRHRTQEPGTSHQGPGGRLRQGAGAAKRNRNRWPVVGGWAGQRPKRTRARFIAVSMFFFCVFGNLIKKIEKPPVLVFCRFFCKNYSTRFFLYNVFVVLLNSHR
jgi:hypothetical protein